MDMKKLEFLDIYPDPISGSEKGYISISYIQHLDIYPGYISNGYISYPFLTDTYQRVNKCTLSDSYFQRANYTSGYISSISLEISFKHTKIKT